MDKDNKQEIPILPSEVKETIIKLGKGNKAIPIFSLKCDEGTYSITHIKTLTLVGDFYYFLSTARTISQQLVELLGEALNTDDRNTLASLFDEPLRDYVMFYQFNNNKKPLPYEDFLSGPEYQHLVDSRRPHVILGLESPEHAKELSEGDTSLGWIPSDRGTLGADELGAIIDGRPFKRNSVD
jgi:hypothetical protein